MKRIVISATILALVCAMLPQVMAEVPQMINYQGRLSDDQGEPLTGTYDVTFTIYDAATGGSDYWADTYTVNAANGLFNVLLGSTNPIPTDVFDSPDRYLGIKIGDDPEIVPRVRLVSAPYAYNSDKLDGYDATDFWTPGLPGEPSGIFRCYLASSSNSFVPLCDPEPFPREITNIVVSSSDNTWVLFRIEGEEILYIQLSSTSSLNEIWNRGNGAGILIDAGETLEISVRSGYTARVTVVGYEY